MKSMQLTSSRSCKGCLTGNQLKIIAMVSMLLDHVGLVLFPDLLIFRILGRISFPIFAYMIAEGCFYTRNRVRYLLHLLILGVGCQVVFFIATGMHYLGILITFSLSVTVICTVDHFLRRKCFWNGALVVLVLLGVAFAAVIAPILWREQGYDVDYGYIGVLIPIVVYYMPTRLWKLLSLGVLLAVMAATAPAFQWASMGALILLLLYNGHRGRASMKYVFYVFYPVHLVVVYGIGMLISYLSQ